MLQSTISKSVEMTGIGLHSGSDVKIKLSPAPADSGIMFYYHGAKKTVSFSPTPFVVHTTELATTLGAKDVSISTVEHLLAAIHAMQIDNIEVHVYSSLNETEIPILDGSSEAYLEAIKLVGLKYYSQKRKYARVTKPFSTVEGNKSINARPYNGLYIDYTIEFPHSAIGKQRLALEITPETFEEIAHARTFGFMKEIEYLHSKGLARGGSLKNAIVLDDEGVVNPDGLRYVDEFVRHKILDFVGDIAMLGLPLHAAFEVKCSGHKHNNQFLRDLVASHSFEVVDNQGVETIETLHPLALPQAAYNAI